MTEDDRKTLAQIEIKLDNLASKNALMNQNIALVLQRLTANEVQTQEIRSDLYSPHQGVFTKIEKLDKDVFTKIKELAIKVNLLSAVQTIYLTALIGFSFYILKKIS